MTVPPAAAHRQAGFVAGGEVLPFGVLIFVVGALLITNAWLVIDAKFAAGAAAREAGRVYVEAPDAAAGAAAARAAADDAIRAYGKHEDHLDLELTTGPGFERCERVTTVARYRVPAVSLPFGIGLGDMTVTARHSEIVDPLRSGLGPANSCGY